MESKDDKYQCCQENHFMKFSDFDEHAQSEFIEWELDEYEKLLDKEEASK
jgi:CRISPR/Cas system CMR-associated protein Cmr3 (group 5 of RAMP superfamily)